MLSEFTQLATGDLEIQLTAQGRTWLLLHFLMPADEQLQCLIDEHDGYSLVLPSDMRNMLNVTPVIGWEPHPDSPIKMWAWSIAPMQLSRQYPTQVLLGDGYTVFNSIPQRK